MAFMNIRGRLVNMDNVTHATIGFSEVPNRPDSSQCELRLHFLGGGFDVIYVNNHEKVIDFKNGLWEALRRGQGEYRVMGDPPEEG